jgi:hypothetical protein
VRLVTHAAIRPHRCAVIPFIGNSNAKEGFVDTGMDLPGWDPHVYVSVEAVKEMARLIGWQPSTVLQGHKQKVETLQRKLEGLEAENEALSEQLAAVHTLKQNGYTASKRVGRPPNQKAAA